MTVNPSALLSELERDALAELSNIAMATASTRIREMVGAQIAMSVPSVEILTVSEAGRVLTAEQHSRLAAVRQDFTGAFAGTALLIFPEAKSLQLVSAVLGKDIPAQDIVDLEDDALCEIGNIILNCWMAVLAKSLDRALRMSIPCVVRGMARDIFEPIAGESMVLYLRIRFSSATKSVEGYVALLMGIPSIEELRRLIKEYVSNIVGCPIVDGGAPEVDISR